MRTLGTRPAFVTCNRLPALPIAVAIAFALFGNDVSAEQVETKTARIVVFGAFGTPKNIVVTGRVVEDLADTGQKERGRLANVAAAIDVLETDEVKHANISANLDGIGAHTVTDEDGLFRFRFRPRKTIPPGPVSLTLSLRTKTHHAATVSMKATVVADALSVGIVSDFDDTLVNTYVANKARLALEVMTKNAAQLTPVPGGGVAFQHAQKAGASAFFYVSSSPQSFADRVRSFLDRQGFPRGAVLLKNYGAEKVFAHHGYKTRRIETLFRTFPKMKFILVGDSGEADPVIYRDLRTQYPGRVAAIIIRKASDKELPKDIAPVTFVPDYEGRATLLSDLVKQVLAGDATGAETKDRK